VSLTPKQQRFVDEYLVDLNATQAAIRAGYSPKTADRQGHRLLKNAEIAQSVAAGREARAERTELTADWVLTKLREEAENANTDSARVRALELLGKHLALFVDKVEHSGEIGPPRLEVVVKRAPRAP